MVGGTDSPGTSGVAGAKRRPGLRRTLRITGIVIVGWIAAGMLFVFLADHGNAKRARSSVHAGMSVAEVLHSVTGWISLGASSDASESDPEHLHAVNLGFLSESTKFSYYDRARRADRELSESEALGMLRERLGDGTVWRLQYTFLTSTPQHLSFTVVFDRNGRVQEVTPMHGWD